MSTGRFVGEPQGSPDGISVPAAQHAIRDLSGQNASLGEHVLDLAAGLDEATATEIIRNQPL